MRADHEILDAFHAAESTARRLREATLTTSTAGAIRAAHRAPTPQLLGLLERYETAAERLLEVPGAETIRGARGVVRDARRRARAQRPPLSIASFEA